MHQVVYTCNFSILLGAHTQMMNIPSKLFSRTFVLLAGCLIIVLSALTLSGCSYFNQGTGYIANSVTPYRIDIIQGNFISREMASQLKTGMSRDQVRFVLGTPLVTDMFHADRWDYVFAYRTGSGKNKGQVEQHNLALFFEGDRLARYTATEDLPTEAEFVERIDASRPKARTSIWGNLFGS